MSGSDSDEDPFEDHQSGVAELKGRRASMEDAHVNDSELEGCASGTSFKGGGGEIVLLGSVVDTLLIFFLCFGSPTGSGLYAVFDGHGGQRTAKFIAERIPAAFAAHSGVTDFPGDIDKAFKE
jgi:serine/threonine protein phosphatase PrpC